MTAQEIVPFESLLKRAETMRHAIPMMLIFAIGVALALLTLSELMRLGAFSRIDKFAERHATLGVFIVLDLVWAIRAGRHISR
ncbi:MAG: hypothetical protein KDK26_01735 [Roseivivax sp.]|nr:hypothetical protein [Roseivivax sp.]